VRRATIADDALAPTSTAANAPRLAFRGSLASVWRYPAGVSVLTVMCSVKAPRVVWSVALLMTLLGAIGTAHADRTRALGSALQGAARAPLALAATRLFIHVDEAQGGPRLDAPSFAHELERSWSVAPDALLTFDAMAAVLELASVLAVIPALPRLDGRARLSLAREATADAVWNAADCAPVDETMPGATTCDRFVDAATLTAAGRGEQTGAPGAELRGASSRLLRSFGIGSISGQPVLVLDGAEDPAAAARRDLDALAWLHLPARPWQMPDADDDMAMLALRAHRGRGAMGVTTKLTIRSATLRFIGTF